MDDYIFLLIAVALSIFGAINQSKKKKAAQNALSQEDEKPRNFFMDQLLGEDFLEEPEIQEPKPIKREPAPVAVIQKSKVTIPTGMNFQPSRFKSTLPERLKHKTILTIQKQEEEEEITGTEESIDYLEDFSLRKAFVYSQILEQKY